jgi:hypothetical protein
MDAQNGMVTRLGNWAKKPITDDMDMVAVVMTTILVVTIAFAWTRVLRLVTE